MLNLDERAELKGGVADGQAEPEPHKYVRAWGMKTQAYSDPVEQAHLYGRKISTVLTQ